MAPMMKSLLTKYGVAPTDMSPCLKHFGFISGLLEVYLTTIPGEISKDNMGGTNAAGNGADDIADNLDPMPVMR